MQAVPILFVLTVTAGSLAHTRPAAAQDAPADKYQPRFEEADCPFEASPQLLEQVRCGWLTVPQNRAAPDGRQLRLAVAILKSTGPAPKPDPIVYLQGGPGLHAVNLVPRFPTGPFWDGLRAERDLVFFDQRGTGFSEPEFCPEVTREWFDSLIHGLDEQQRSERMQPVLARCGEAMRARGVDLSQYNSVASALDLQDLRRALGYEAWNLLGWSYGSRLGLEALRTAPEGIRSAVFDAPLPPNVRTAADAPATLADIVRRLAAACAADAACAMASPDLEQRVWSTLEELDDDPWLLRGGSRVGLPDPIAIDGFLFSVMLFQLLYRAEVLPLVPLFIEEVGRRNRTMVLSLAGPMARGYRNTAAFSRGMALAVDCYESLPFSGRAERGGRHPEILDRVGIGTETGTLDWCDAWHPYRAGPELAEPVRSDVPTLIITGEFDPVTPTRYGRLAVMGLPNGHVVDVPAKSHVSAPHHPCTRAMVREFFEDPSRAPDTACIAEQLEPIRFVTDVRVAPGVSRLAELIGSPNPPKLLPAALGLPLLVLLGSVAGWPAAAGVARLRRRERLVRTPFERRARWGAVAFTLTALAFLVGLAWAVLQTVAESPMILLFGVPGWAAPLLWVPWLLLAGSSALAATAALAWRRGAWTRWGRIHFGLVALASAVLVATLFAVGLA